MAATVSMASRWEAPGSTRRRPRISALPVIAPPSVMGPSLALAARSIPAEGICTRHRPTNARTPTTAHGGTHSTYCQVELLTGYLPRLGCVTGLRSAMVSEVPKTSSTGSAPPCLFKGGGLGGSGGALVALPGLRTRPYVTLPGPIPAAAGAGRPALTAASVAPLVAEMASAEALASGPGGGTPGAWCAFLGGGGLLFASVSQDLGT